MANLDLGDPEFTGAHVVPPRSTNVVPAPVPISLIDKPNVNQDGCKNATFRFTFSGTAQYTDTTSTVLTSSASPTAQGTPVTFTATVAAGNADRHGGRPTGTVTFYTCASAGCDPTTVLGTATIGAGSQATLTTSVLPGGTTRVRAVHAGSGTDYAGSSSNVVSQVVTLDHRDADVLATSLKSSTLGQPVMLTATVTSRGRSAAPSGSVAFFLIPASGAHTLLGTRLLDPGAQASLTVSSMPAGSGGLYAVYQGSTPFARSTSEVIRHAIIAPPPECTGTYATWIIATPDTPVVRGTPGTDFIYAVGGNYRIKGRQGNDCLVAGDGTNRIADGKGADVVIAGDGRNKVYIRGSRNTVIVGDGARNRVKIRNGNGNLITVGDGFKPRVKIRKGNGNQITVGNGDRARVRVRKGKDNLVTMGSGNRNRAFVRKGNRNWIAIGDGARSRVKVRTGNKSRIEVGAGDRNRVFIRKGRKSQITVGDGYKNKVIVRQGQQEPHHGRRRRPEPRLRPARQRGPRRGRRWQQEPPDHGQGQAESHHRRRGHPQPDQAQVGVRPSPDRHTRQPQRGLRGSGKEADPPRRRNPELVPRRSGEGNLLPARAAEPLGRQGQALLPRLDNPMSGGDHMSRRPPQPLPAAPRPGRCCALWANARLRPAPSWPH